MGHAWLLANGEEPMDSERLENIKQGITGWTKAQKRREETKGIQVKAVEDASLSPSEKAGCECSGPKGSRLI